MVPPVFPVSGRQLTADQLTAGALVLSVGCWIARRIWVYVEQIDLSPFDRGFSHLGWHDGGLVVTVAIVLTGAALLLLSSRKPVGRMVSGIAAGMIFVEQLSVLFGNFDDPGDTLSNWWDWGGCMAIPGTLFALGAVAALLRAAASDASGDSTPQRIFG